MQVQRKGTPYLDAGEVTIDERDIESLRGVDEHGSLHSAASELGRSYARMHERIVELEEIVGPLVERQRGGSGGGGSSLTTGAKQLLRQYDRFCAELSSFTAVKESVFSGQVVEYEDELVTIETGAGSIKTFVPGAVNTDIDAVQVGVRADMVTLTTPGNTPNQPTTSAQNQFQGTIVDLKLDEPAVRLAIDIGADSSLQALITCTSLERLNVALGDTVVASFKATATRGIPEG